MRPHDPRLPLPERNWDNLPGHFDKCKFYEQFEGDGFWGIPKLPPLKEDPKLATVLAFDDWRAAKNKGEAPEGCGVNFFIDDYRFESIWMNPEHALDILEGAAAVFSPDFSMYRDTPHAVQLWNKFRNHWLGAFFASHGFIVIPTANWSTLRSYRYCWAGMPKDSIIGVSTVGSLGHPNARKLFMRGYEEMVKVLKPKKVLVYGGESAKEELGRSCQIQTFPTFQSQLRMITERKKAANAANAANEGVRIIEP